MQGKKKHWLQLNTIFGTPFLLLHLVISWITLAQPKIDPLMFYCNTRFFYECRGRTKNENEKRKEMKKSNILASNFYF